MMQGNNAPNSIKVYVQSNSNPEMIEFLAKNFDVCITNEIPDIKTIDLALNLNAEGLSLVGGGQMLHGDFTRMQPRLRLDNLNRELLVKAAKIKGADAPLTVIDATAGLGEDSLLLAAAGFKVTLYERDPIIAALLKDALLRASEVSGLAEIVSRMQLAAQDSITDLHNLSTPPDVVFLDPMFPARNKKALIKKKFQLLQQLEHPCTDGDELLHAAIACNPRKIVIKRPLNGANLADRKPDYSLKGKTIRYDCIVVNNK